jgi:magnesium chelatase subunit D
VAVIAFEGERAQVLLEPTASTRLAQERLRVLPIGGATPLAAGLSAAWQLIRAERLRDPQLEPTLVLLSDGGANVPLRRGADVRAELRTLAARIRGDGIRSLVIDAAARGEPRRELVELAERLGTRHRRLERLHAAAIVEALEE